MSDETTIIKCPKCHSSAVLTMCGEGIIGSTEYKTCGECKYEFDEKTEVIILNRRYIIRNKFLSDVVMFGVLIAVMGFFLGLIIVVSIISALFMEGKLKLP